MTEAEQNMVCIHAYLDLIAPMIDGGKYIRWVRANAQEWLGRPPTPPQFNPWIRRRRPKTRQCFGNAQMLTSLGDQDASYVEGWAMGVIPFDHGWNATPAGECVDLTWDAADKISDEPTRETTAYLGVVIPRWFVVRQTVLSERWGPVLYHWYNCVCPPRAERSERAE